MHSVVYETDIGRNIHAGTGRLAETTDHQGAIHAPPLAAIYAHDTGAIRVAQNRAQRNQIAPARSDKPPKLRLSRPRDCAPMPVSTMFIE